MSDDLADILGEIETTTPSYVEADRRHQDDLRGPIWKQLGDHEAVALWLTGKELKWLSWRLKVHIDSYKLVEFDEMKKVIEGILAKIDRRMGEDNNEHGTGELPSGGDRPSDSTISSPDLPQVSEPVDSNPGN